MFLFLNFLALRNPIWNLGNQDRGVTWCYYLGVVRFYTSRAQKSLGMNFRFGSYSLGLE